MKTETKIKKVEDWIRSGKPITVLGAINMFNYYRLSDGIYKIKKRLKANEYIETTMCHNFNTDTRYASYELKTME